jgi:hypothetical protein
LPTGAFGTLICRQVIGCEMVYAYPAIPAARIKVLYNPIISSLRQPVGCLYLAVERLF